MKRKLVINYRNLLMGGIEDIISILIKNSIDMNDEIIWLSDVEPKISPIYKDLLRDSHITRIPCNIHGVYWSKFNNIDFLNYGEIVIISFSFFDHIRILQQIKKSPNSNIKPYYIIPHFTGGLVFPEQLVWNLKIVRYFAGKIYKRWLQANMLVYCGKRHADKLSENYKGNFIYENGLFPNIEGRAPFDEGGARRNYHNTKFRIVTAGRLDFPHKGFVVGLLKSFIRLKSDRRYNKLELFIIGEGKGRSELSKIVDACEPFIATDIHFLDNMSKDKLVDFFHTCNLNISVAGCFTLGAQNGLLSLPARHYSFDCEVYGFSPNSIGYSLEDKPGEPVEKYIVKAMKLSENEYVDYCRSSYNAYDVPTVDKNAFFNQNNIDTGYIIGRKEILFGQIVFYFDKIKFYFHKFFLRDI